MTPQGADKQTDMLNKLKRLSASYVPEWHFDTENPDAGSVIAMLGASMLEESVRSSETLLRKHKIQYLNLFDKLKEEPIESAKSYVRFSTVTGAEEPVYIPKGTQLIAESDTTESPVVFETCYGITAVNADLLAVYTTDRDSDTIAELFHSNTGSAAETCSFTAFDLEQENLAEHILLLGFHSLYSGLDTLQLALEVSTVSEQDLEPALKALASPGVTYFLPAGEGEFEEFDRVEREGNKILLYKEHYTPVRMPLRQEEEYDVLAIRSDLPSGLQISSIKIYQAGEDIPANEVICAGISQNPYNFLPFGRPLEIYAECGVEAEAVFARKGARVTMRFDLAFDMVEQLLPEIETDLEYKLIMKRPRSQPKPTVVEVKPDVVMFEYLSHTGWRRLIQEEHVSLLFNGSAQGNVSVSFQVPGDMADKENAAGQYRLRMRLIRADNIYQMPCIQHVPVVSGLRFSYHYNEAPILPDYACTRNNFDVQDVTMPLRQKRSVELFYSREQEKTAMYFGFGNSCWGTPLSLYFHIENNADYSVDFTVEYLSPSGFLPLKAVDNTDGLLYSETLLMIIPPDMARKELFKRDLFWLRFINHNKTSLRHHMPVINGIYANMAKVENVNTQTATYYVDDIDGLTRINLEAQGLISAKVYVNEENHTAPGEDNWVLWHTAFHREEQGRIYEIDLTAGEITFPRNVFAMFPLREAGPHIQVVFQSYRGSEANVEAGKIHTLASSLRYISGVRNPMPAYGGYDGYNEETSAAIISNMLRTRGRAVTRQDYFDIISQVCYGVRRVKCCSGVNIQGAPVEDAFTVAVLVEEYEKGGHIFSAIKNTIREKLLSCSGLVPMGKTLMLSQPHFIRISVRLWLVCERMENAYDLQKQVLEDIRRFIDPLEGGFDGAGWEIGTLPGVQQLLAYLKIRNSGVAVANIVMTAFFNNRELPVSDTIYAQIGNPFAMAVNGRHIVYVDLAEKA